jgi:hypothetical protein
VTLAGAYQEIFIGRNPCISTGKAVVQISAIQIPVDHLLDVGPPETVLPGEVFVIDLLFFL